MRTDRANPKVYWDEGASTPTPPGPSYAVWIHCKRTALSATEADSIARWAGSGVLAFPVMKEADAGVLKALEGWSGATLNLAGLTSLSAKGAESLAAVSGTLNLSGLRSVDAATARALGSVRAKTLKLNGLEQLSPAVAEALVPAGVAGGTIDLRGVTRLAPGVVEILAAGRKRIRLQNVELSFDEMAVCIASDTATIQFPVRRVNDDLLLKMVQSGRPVVLEDLASISVEQARILAGAQGRLLNLDGLTSPKPGVLEAVAEAKVRHLALNGLTTVTLAQAQALVARPGRRLSLGGIEDLPGEVAGVLLASGSFKVLSSLKRLRASDELSTLSKMPYLPSIEVVDLKAAELLAAVPGNRDFHRMVAIEPKVLQALASPAEKSLGLSSHDFDAAEIRSLHAWSGDRAFIGITGALGVARAQALAGMRVKKLYVKGVDMTIDAAAAKELAAFGGGLLMIEGTKTLDAAALLSYPGKLVLGGPLEGQHP